MMKPRTDDAMRKALEWRFRGRPRGESQVNRPRGLWRGSEPGCQEERTRQEVARAQHLEVIEKI